MRQLYDRHLGPDWPPAAASPAVWDKIDGVDDGELWETHQTLKARLIELARRSARRCRPSAAASSAEFVDAGGERLELRRADDRIRAPLRHLQAGQPDLPRPRDRSPSLVNDPQMPMQFVFAGKAHPHDRPGKEVLQQIARLMRDPRFAGKIVFVEDYDINVGRHLVQGVDVWLNNPRRPLEACGHERPEGRAQRRTESVGPRRLVGRGVRRPERLRDRHRARRTRPSTSTISATALALLTALRRRGDPALLRSRPRRPAARAGSRA